MADASTNVPQISSGQSAKEVILNRLTDGTSSALLWSRKDESCTGLTWAYRGGRYKGSTIADGTVTATASNTNYIVAARSNGAVSISTSITNWNDTATYFRLYLITAGGSSINSDWQDFRDLWGQVAAAGTGTASTLDFDTDGTLAANSDAKIATQKATKTYVDAKVAGLSWKQAVRVATTSAGTLSTSFENSDTVDGVTLATGDRILIKNQASASENGIYVVAASGSPARSTDADSGAELVNATVYVSEGTANADTQWTQTTNATITIGASSIVWAQLTASGSGVKVIQVALSDLSTPIAAGTSKAVFRMPYAMTLTAGVNGVRGSLMTAQTSGGLVTIDINESGASILGNLLTFDNTEKTTVTAATAVTISDTALADDAEITIDIDSIGDGTAIGLVVTLIGT